jgi:carbon storage regulator
MLVLTRKPGQTVRIGEDIEIRVLQATGNRVKISIDAPERVTILRGELDAGWSCRVPGDGVCDLTSPC